jgi:ABC-type multidrug transport system permease subunit
MSVAVAPHPPPRHRSKGALVLHQLHYDALSFLRNRQSRFFTLALPVVFLVLFCALFGNGTVHVAGGTIKESTYYVPGLVGFGLIQAAFANLVISVTTQRESGVLMRRRSTGVFVPSAEIPHWLTDIANVFPVSHLQKALLEAFNPHTVGAGFAWSDLLVLGIWGVVGLAIALRRFGWKPKAR